MTAIEELKKVICKVPHSYVRIFTGPPSENEKCRKDCNRCALDVLIPQLLLIVKRERAEAALRQHQEDCLYYSGNHACGACMELRAAVEATKKACQGVTR